MNKPPLISSEEKQKVTDFLMEALVKINSAEMIYITSGLSKELNASTQGQDLRTAISKILGVYKSLK